MSGEPSRLITGTEAAATEAQLVTQTLELARFTRYLQLLHRLSTTDYASINALFADYLRIGCEIFNTSCAAIAARENGDLCVRESFGDAESDPHGAEVTLERRTVIIENPEDFYVGTPIRHDDVVWGSMSFWSENRARSEPLHPQAREIAEMMAKSIGVAIRQRELTDQLAFQARHDPLTGLPNRLELQERLDRAIAEARSRGETLSVVFIDLDRFKYINDTLGHGAGDRVLQQIATRLKSCIGQADTLARMGGDEFVAILTAADPVQAPVIVRKLLATVQAPVRHGDHELFVTASIGVSAFPKNGSDSATLLRNADAAMYTAKYRGKNNVEWFDANIQGSPSHMPSLEHDLRRALEREELQLMYQPQVELTGRIAGFEVLLVWEHPERGRIPPGDFIPIAEETGIILPIGSWVLKQACLQVAEWRQVGYEPVPVAVNVSALQFAQANFVPTVAGTLAYSGVPPGLLELELTESLVMRGVEQSVNVMQQIRDLGVRIAIDDFGTGYSSLAYIRQLPAHALKIDRSFLTDIGPAGSSLAMIKTITTLAHTFGLGVTAEGVETNGHLELVRKAGCDKAQGLLFGGPLSAGAVEGMLKL